MPACPRDDEWKARVSPAPAPFLGLRRGPETLLGGHRGLWTCDPRAFGYFQPEATLSVVLLSPYVDCRGCNVSIPRAADPIHAQPREARPQTHHSTMTTTLGCFSAGLGRRTDLPWPLPKDAGQVREKGYFVEGGKESLPPKWDPKVMARPNLPADISGVDAYHKKLSGEVDGNGEPTIAVFLKTGPPGRAPALVVEGVSVSAAASVLADRAAKDLGVPVDALYYHGVALDMAQPLEAQGVFRDPVLLEWK